MGLMDKVKQQAGQALQKAQQGVSQGQAKLDQVQAKRQADALFRNLGAAYYAQQRENGPAEAVEAAMVALDEHVRSEGPVDTDAVAPDGASSTTEASGSSPPPPGASGTPSGDFKIGDL